MPDWSYRTVLGGLLSSLPPARAQQLALAALGVLGAQPLGRGLIDLLGHMRPDPRLGQRVHGLSLSGPVGLAAFVDPEARASAALSRFGAGFLELGPVVDGEASTAVRWSRPESGALATPAPARVALRALHKRLAESPPLSAPVWLRIAASAEPSSVVLALRAHVAVFLLEVADDLSLDALRARVIEVVALACADGGERAVLLSLRADEARAVELTQAALASGARGVWVRGELLDHAGAHVFGSATRAPVEASVRKLREAAPAALIVAGGVLSPDDVRRFSAAGASLSAVDAGLVVSGPGLIKRCNEALLLSQDGHAEAESFSLEAARSAWFWAFLLGLSMLFGGVLALVIASTRVILPYDEALCGMTRGQLMSLNPRLLPFMAHDRVSLAGSMLSIGVLYSALAYQGLRRGAHWAQMTVVCSALCGFFSIFLFLGFGYFDPFHAFVTGVLFQLLLLCISGERRNALPLEIPDWLENAAFRRGQWGQLLFVLLGAGLIGAGAVICFLGCTSVFVQEDLDFMRTTAAQLAVAHERLLPLVAHDRASLGGMLLANGVAVLCCALWGFRAGAAWLWWALLWAGNLAFAAGVGVHFVVGYTAVFHLAPAFAGWALWWLALGLSHGWLTSLGTVRAGR